MICRLKASPKHLFQCWHGESKQNGLLQLKHHLLLFCWDLHHRLKYSIHKDYGPLDTMAVVKATGVMNRESKMTCQSMRWIWLMKGRGRPTMPKLESRTPRKMNCCSTHEAIVGIGYFGEHKYKLVKCMIVSHTSSAPASCPSTET